MTNSITKMKLMLLALCFKFITSQEESISPYKGMSEMNRCRVYKVIKNITAVDIMLLGVCQRYKCVPVDYKILGSEYCFSLSIDLFSLYGLFSHFRPRDGTRGNSFFQMSSCARANVRIINEKNKSQTPMRASRGLKWEKKTYKLKRSILRPS